MFSKKIGNIKKMFVLLKHAQYFFLNDRALKKSQIRKMFCTSKKCSGISKNIPFFKTCLESFSKLVQNISIQSYQKLSNNDWDFKKYSCFQNLFTN